MNKDLISIIVPVYNAENYIDKCLKSLLNQFYKNIEIIIIDDGSCDNTSKICKSFLEDKRIKYFFQNNQGPAASRNKGLVEAKGEWVMFVDSDDIISPQFCEVALTSVKASNSDLGMFRFNVVEDNHTFKNISIKTKKDNYFTVSKERAFSFLLDDKISGSYLWNKIYKKDLFENIRFEVGKKYEDLGIMYKLFNIADSFVFIDEYLYFYIQRPDSVMHSTTVKDINDAFTYRYKQFLFIKKNYPHLVKKATPLMIFNSIQELIRCYGFAYRNNRYNAKLIIKNYNFIEGLGLKYKIFYYILKLYIKFSI